MIYRRTPYIPSRDPLSAVPPSRHPFQFWVMFACVIGGLGDLIDRTGSLVNHLLPLWAVVAWGVILMTGGGLAIIAAWWHDRITGLLMERIALGAIALGCLVYGVTLLQLLGQHGLISAALTISITVACVWRVVHVNRELRILRSFIERSNLE